MARQRDEGLVEIKCRYLKDSKRKEDKVEAVARKESSPFVHGPGLLSVSLSLCAWAGRESSESVNKGPREAAESSC